jgi:hypothetical protein
MTPGYHSLLILSLIVFCQNLSAQTKSTERQFIPYLDRESQSNVVVFVCDRRDGCPCPKELANVLSNRNLFTAAEEQVIQKVFLKYKNVTTNSGPTGTIPVSLEKTNYTVTALGRTFEGENWIARFQYTNSTAREEIKFATGLSTKYRTDSDDGYDVFFVQTGNGTLMRFGEVKRGKRDGVLVEFQDSHPQGMTWDFRQADFDNIHLGTYWHYRGGMVLGKFLMWNLRDGNLLIKAEFKEPYDWGKNYLATRSPP